MKRKDRENKKCVSADRPAGMVVRTQRPTFDGRGSSLCFRIFST